MDVKRFPPYTRRSLALVAAAVVAASAVFAQDQVIQTRTVGGGGGASGGPVIMINSSPAAALPPLDPGTGALSGTVIDGVTNQPLSGAVVSLVMQMPPAGNAPTQRRIGQQLTDAKGRFVFTDLPPSDGYELTARRAAYFDSAHGALPGSGTGTRIFLSDGDWFSRAGISLWPTSAVTGRVLDERGDPVVGAYVRVLRRLMVAGREHLAPSAPVTTDDRGAYRVAGLDPGAYVVCAPSVQASVPATANVPAEPALLDVDVETRLVVGRYPTPPSRPGTAVAYVTSCYPGGASMSQATPVEVRYGADASDIDLVLRPTPVFRVSGRVEGPAESLGGLSLRLLPRGSEGLGQGSETATALVSPSGAFTFLNVPAGDYIVDVRGTMAQYQVLATIRGGAFRTAAPAAEFR